MTDSSDSDCIFCKIVAGEIPCAKIGESENFISFLDIQPITEGHALVVPKKHFTDFNEFPPELGAEFVTFTREMMKKLTALDIDGLNIGMNNGKAAGQLVMHQHTHLIPRREGDGLESWPGNKTTPEEIAALAKKLEGEEE